jgi:hypothetical protein
VKRRERTFQKREMKKIAGSEEGGISGGCRKQHNKENTDLQSSANNIRVIKSRRIRKKGQVAGISHGTE